MNLLLQPEMYSLFQIEIIKVTCFGLMNPEVQFQIHKGSPIIRISSRINRIPRIDTHFFKVHSDIVLPSTLRSSKRSIYCRFIGWIFKNPPTFFHSDYITCTPQSSRRNRPDYTRWMVQTMKFLTVLPGWQPSRIWLDADKEVWRIIYGIFQLRADNRRLIWGC